MQAARRRTPLNPGEPNEPAIASSDEEDGATPVGRRMPYFLIFWGVGLAGITLDQVTKAWAERTLEGRGTVEVVGDWLGWRLIYNSGASFSIGTSWTEVLSAVALVALCVVLLLSLRLGSKGWAWGLGFLLAGVSGNLIDRLFRPPGPFSGHVVDFIALPNWPIFNVADICINIAAGLIIIQTIRGIRVNGTFHD